MDVSHRWGRYFGGDARVNGGRQGKQRGEPAGAGADASPNGPVGSFTFGGGGGPRKSNIFVEKGRDDKPSTSGGGRSRRRRRRSNTQIVRE